MNSEMSWVGNERTYVDELNVCQAGIVSIGRFGGNSSSGQYKNEDGCLVWTGSDWELSIVLDAHKTAESANLIVKEFKHHRFILERILEKPVGDAIGALQETILSIFQHDDFRRRCQEVSGETACLIVVRKAKYVWWFSVGDCVLYLFHSELEALGEYKQNHRSFYEWIGEVNTFDTAVPCYSTGTKELRKGKTILLLTTDGLIECPNTNFFSSGEVAKRMKGCSIPEGVRQLLSEVKENGVRDNTTILSWEIDRSEHATMPSNS
ncbi:protein phosphatase 2C domain-containing protein [Alkalihalobacillus macyae]|uniref:protein phosphatase 2C domain-containing protein n=1 Tax=Guptibacillus hwajinpoensis TaxID=208199 RepID=UPI00273B3CEE|nr:protein phosphatase 2C domain-containing protein [Alkalihalobacillus macyae]MDP4549346.1 protein phosphatase 2C domain-containing protein [Alkalihalobacillus macyae]